MCKDNHEQPNRTCQCEENGFSTSLEGLVRTNAQNPSKPVEKPFSSRWRILLGCLWLSLHIFVSWQEGNKHQENQKAEDL